MTGRVQHTNAGARRKSASRMIWLAEADALCAILRRRGTPAARELADVIDGQVDDYTSNGKCIRVNPSAAHKPALDYAIGVLRYGQREVPIREAVTV